MKKGAGVVVAAVGLVFGCTKEEHPRPEPPPPAASARANACVNGGGTLGDAETSKAFPRTTTGFCVDPNGKDRAFGEDAKEPLEKIRDLMDGEGEVYLQFGARRVVELRYVDGRGSPATIDVHFSKFASTEGAFAMFTKRVVADGDPAGPDTPKPIPAAGLGALGRGIAYAWRGPYLVELTYADENANETKLDEAARQLLPPLVADVANKLPGSATLPPSAAALPKDALVPLGLRGVPKDALGVKGLGGAVVGYYGAGEKRWRVVAMARPDVDQAKDVIAALAKVPGASKEKSAGEGGLRAMLKDGESSEVEWIFARAGNVVFGVGDEPLVKRSESAKAALSKDEKIERVKKLGS